MSIEKTLDKAIELHLSGNYGQAHEYYRSIVEKAPSNADACHNLGVLELQMGNMEEGKLYLSKALEINHFNDQYWISYIKFHITINSLEQAQKLVIKWRSLDPKNKKIQEIDSTIADLLKNKLRSELHKPAASSSEAAEQSLLHIFQSGRYEASKNRALEQLSANPAHQLSWKILASSAKNIGELDLALEAGKRAVMLNTLDSEAHNNLGNIYSELGLTSLAESSFRQALNIAPDYAVANRNLAITLLSDGRFSEAEIPARRAVFLKPDYDEALFTLGEILYSLNKIEEARTLFVRCRLTKSSGWKLRCDFKLNDTKEFETTIASLIKSNQGDPLIGSLILQANTRFHRSYKNPFCENPFQYILHRKIHDSNLSLFSNLIAFSNEKMKSNLRFQNLIDHGIQSEGNIFQISNQYIQQVEGLIKNEVHNYYLSFMNSTEGFIRNWPEEFLLYGWLVQLNDGGTLDAHIHEAGWLSGSIYLQVPSDINPDEGNLVLSATDHDDIKCSNEGTQQKLQVKTGDIALFPASLMHHTTPFRSNESRIVLAFDVVPLKK